MRGLTTLKNVHVVLCLIALCSNLLRAHGADRDQSELDAAQAAYQLGQHREAEAHLDRLTARGERELSPSARLTMSELRAELYLASGRYSQAERANQAILEILSSQRNSPATAKILQAAEVRQATIDASRGNFAAAHEHYQKALLIPDGCRNNEPLWEPRLLVLLSEHQSEAVERKHLQQARQLVEQLLEQIEQQRRHLDHRASAGQLLAEIHHRLKQDADAIRAIERAQEAEQKAQGDQQVDLLISLAEYHRRLTNFAEAHAALDKAERVVDAIANKPSPSAEQSNSEASANRQLSVGAWRAELLHARGAIYAAESEREKAEECWKQEARDWRKLLKRPAEKKGEAPELPISLKIEYLQRILAVDRSLASWSDGIATARELLELRQVTLPAGDANIARAEAALGSFYALAAADPRWTFGGSDIGQGVTHTQLTKEAERILEARRQDWTANPEGMQLELFRTLSNLVELRRAGGDFQKALASAEQAAELTDQLLLQRALSDLEHGALQINFGSVLAGMGKYSDARTQYELAAKTEYPDLPWRAIEVKSLALLNTAMLLRSEGQLDKAEEQGAAACVCRESLGAADGPQRVPFYLLMANIQLAKLERLRAAARLTTPGAADLKTLAVLTAANQWVTKAQQLASDHQLSHSPLAMQIQHVNAQVLLHQAVLEDATQRSARLHAAQQAWQLVESQAKEAKSAAEQARSISWQLEVLAWRSLPPETWSREADQLSARGVALADQLQAYPNLCCQVLLQRAQVLLRLAKERDSQARASQTVSSAVSRGMRDQAIAALERALALVEMPRASTSGAERERAEFYAYFAQFFDLLVDAYLVNGQLNRAVQATEWRRNRTLLDQLRVVAASAGKKAQDSPQLAKLRQDEQQVVALLQELLAQARALDADAGLANLASLSAANRAADGEAARAIHAQLSKLNRDVEDARGRLVELRRKIHQHEPFYRNILAEGVTSDFHAAASQALQVLMKPENEADQGSVVLVYHVGRWWSHLFLLAPQQEPMQFPLLVDAAAAKLLNQSVGPVTADKARALVERFLRTAIEGRAAGGVVTSPREQLGPLNSQEWLAASRVLLPPDAVEALRKLKPTRLLVVPDGPLHQLSLEMLNTTETTYVLDELPPVHYTPSALIMQTIRERSTPDSQRALLLTAAPIYSGERLAASNNRAADYAQLFGYRAARLQGAEAESRQVAELFARLTVGGSSPEARQSIIALNDPAHPATEAAVKQELQGVRFVHLAAHGRIEEHFDNLFGGLLLSPSSTRVEDDVLSLYDIERLQLRGCQLVILSACETNRGPDRPLEAGSTLARAFLASGADRVVCSQWEVDDASTQQLIVDFSRRITQQLAAGGVVDYARALHEARRRIRNDPNPKWHHPHHWAPFVLVGPAVGPPLKPVR